MESGEAAEELADTLQKMFSFEKKVGNSSVFAGTGFELMKKPGRGANGHIAIATNYIDRAVYHLEKRGFEFEQESAVIKEGKLKAIYFKGEFGGFAMHLVQK
jgi:2-dehydro-3-deoxyphosphogluconate aldolase/(4S)-4-hydroxy-2-oxoglutarate aldolase